MALFLLACGPTPPPLKTVPLATRLVETIEAKGPTGNTVILYGKVIDVESRQEIPLRPFDFAQGKFLAQVMVKLRCLGTAGSEQGHDIIAWREGAL